MLYNLRPMMPLAMILARSEKIFKVDLTAKSLSKTSNHRSLLAVVRHSMLVV
jgi:hypothetical protein